jgi:uncharacterized protein
MFFIIFLVIGAISGLLAGLLGLGGGVIVVPALAAVFTHYHLLPEDQVMLMAIGTSLSTIVVTFTASLFSHLEHDAVRWNFVRMMLPGLMIGVVAGALIAHDLPAHYLRIFFCIFLLVIAFRLIFAKNNEITASQPPRYVLFSVPIGIGMLSSVLGVGGGVILMPFLLRCQLNMRDATGTSVACGIGIGVMATLSFMLFGRTAVDLPWSTGYIYWPAFLGVAAASVIFAPLGTRLAYRLPAEFLKRFLAVFLICIAIEMLLT